MQNTWAYKLILAVQVMGKVKGKVSLISSSFYSYLLRNIHLFCCGSGTESLYTFLSIKFIQILRNKKMPIKISKVFLICKANMCWSLNEV